jgi:4-hydroxybenzoyl-CoA thioesterase
MFVYRTPVRFADVDHAGIVYYPRFFHFFHLAFEEFFTSRLGPRGYVALLDVDRVGFPAVSAKCDYRAPLRFGDVMEIEVTVTRLGAKSVTFGYRVWRAAEAAPDGEAAGAGGVSGAAPARERLLAAEGQVVSAVVDLEGFRAVAIPGRVRALLADLVVSGAAGGPG